MKITLLILAALEVASGSPSLSVVDVHVPLPPKITTVTHKKHANGGYKKGSPLYNKQERLEAKVPKHHSKQPLVATLPEAQKTERSRFYKSLSLIYEFLSLIFVQLSPRIIVQLIFGVLYYCLVVSHYPKLDEVNGGRQVEEAKKLQELNEVSAAMEVSLPNCFLSLCCTGPRAAHTFHSTGIMDYWAGCLLMSCCPCITLWIVNSFTELNLRLQGEKKNFCMGAICACFCSCCMVAQDAQSLDYLTGMDKTSGWYSSG